MKKRGFVLCLLAVILCLQVVSALNTTLKEKYSPKETIIIKIVGKVLEPIFNNQVKLVRMGHVQEVPIEYEVKKIGEEYYFWAIAPKTEDNYTLIIENIQALERGVPAEIDYRQNFSIRGETKGYSIKPGAIVTDKDFSIKIISYQDEIFKIGVDFPEEKEIEIQPGENIIDFSIEKVSGASIKMIKIGEYIIPAQITGDISKMQESIPLRFEPPSIKREYKTEKDKVISFELINKGDKDLKEIEIKYSENVFSISHEGNISLKVGKRFQYNLTLKKEDKIAIREIIYARTKNLEIAFPIAIDFSGEVSDETEETDKSKLYKCTELGGKICKGQEICEGSKKLSLEGQCCIGSCVAEEGKSSANKIIGYILAVVVIIGLGYLYMRYRKTKNTTNPISKKIKEAERRS